MRLIDAPIGIFRFDDELVLKTEYWSENKLSGKYIPDCYIIRTGEYFWGGAKTANELNNLDVEPVDFAELLPTATDIISRKQAIEAIEEIVSSMSVCLNRGERRGMKRMQGYAVDVIKELPSAEPQIIRCKDCKHRDPEDKKCDCGHDIRWQLPRRDDWYCADAERMEVDNDEVGG